MENKRRKKRAKVSKPTEKKVKTPKTDDITFEMFFVKCVREGKLKPWQRDEISAFFKDNKLREKEDLKVYEKMLERY